MGGEIAYTFRRSDLGIGSGAGNGAPGPRASGIPFSFSSRSASIALLPTSPASLARRDAKTASWEALKAVTVGQREHFLRVLPGQPIADAVRARLSLR
jgi:hypothetical protein